MTLIRIWSFWVNQTPKRHYLTIFHFAVVGCWLVFRANLHLVIWRLYRSAASHTETDKQTRESNLHQQSVSVVWLRWLMSEQVSKPCSFFCKIEFFSSELYHVVRRTPHPLARTEMSKEKRNCEIVPLNHKVAFWSFPTRPFVRFKFLQRPAQIYQLGVQAR